MLDPVEEGRKAADRDFWFCVLMAILVVGVMMSVVGLTLGLKELMS